MEPSRTPSRNPAPGCRSGDPSPDGPTKELRRVLVLTPWKRRWSLGGGAGVSDDYHFIEAFSRAGVELHFLMPRSNEPTDVPFANFFAHTYPNFFDATQSWPTFLKRILWPTLFNIIVAFRAVSVAKRTRPDFILGHSHYSSLPCYVAAELLRVPSGVKLFGVMDLVHTEWSRARYVFKNIEQILALKIPQDVWIILDDGTRGRAAARRYGVPEERIRFLPNGINIEWMNRLPLQEHARATLGLPEDAPVALFLARLVASKRADLLIRAIPAVLRRSPDALFVIAGDGPERARCEALVNDLGIAGSVRFVGRVLHENVPDIMAAADIFISTGGMTNMTIPACEALVCGLPVVAFDVGETNVIVKDGETGRLVKSGDIAALATGIAGLLSDPKERRRMSANAQQFAAASFTAWNERTKQELKILRDIVRGNSSPA